MIYFWVEKLTIPLVLREKLGLAVGDYVQADIEDERIVIRPVEVVGTAEGERRRSSKERQKAYAILDEISRQMIDEEPEAIEETINEAVRQAFVNIFTAETQSEEQ
jgi:bifunctional DNA-binding transcriptional regulator/antitoxin component of YhaV-PrlF toxin-antitoxin module